MQSSIHSLRNPQSTDLWSTRRIAIRQFVPFDEYPKNIRSNQTTSHGSNQKGGSCISKNNSHSISLARTSKLLPRDLFFSRDIRPTNDRLLSIIHPCQEVDASFQKFLSPVDLYKKMDALLQSIFSYFYLDIEIDASLQRILSILSPIEKIIALAQSILSILSLVDLYKEIDALLQGNKQMPRCYPWYATSRAINWQNIPTPPLRSRWPIVKQPIVSRNSINLTNAVTHEVLQSPEGRNSQSVYDYKAGKTAIHSWKARQGRKKSWKSCRYMQIVQRSNSLTVLFGHDMQLKMSALVSPENSANIQKDLQDTNMLFTPGFPTTFLKRLRSLKSKSQPSPTYGKRKLLSNLSLSNVRTLCGDTRLKQKSVMLGLEEEFDDCFAPQSKPPDEICDDV